MNRPTRIAATAAVALLTLSGCDDNGRPEDGLGTVYTVEPRSDEPLDRVEGPASVDHGKRFSIAVLTSASARREWKPAEAGPPGGVVRPAGNSTRQTKEQKESDGSGYTMYFTFDAVKPGKTKILFTNRCGDRKQRCYSPGALRTLTYRVTVR
ncbi:protease inhibitor I42 family protein [Streptomyces sp. CA-181903]|uniref:protease inhibitor I42 family protein n=1 Tax=Streptomyces sp. CA-181903 TaxID=3240055 RepID=UPI003D8B775D